MFAISPLSDRVRKYYEPHIAARLACVCVCVCMCICNLRSASDAVNNKERGIRESNTVFCVTAARASISSETFPRRRTKIINTQIKKKMNENRLKEDAAARTTHTQAYAHALHMHKTHKNVHHPTRIYAHAQASTDYMHTPRG